MTQEDVANYVKKMTFKDGDILFVDADAVDVEALVRSVPVHSIRVSVCAVVVPYGKTLAECIEQSKTQEKTQSAKH